MSDAAETSSDEQRIARLVSIGLPAATVVAAAVVGVAVGPSMSILVVAAGLILGVIALLWASLRTLSGDAPLSPEMAELDMAEGGDPLLARKKMLLRALKDLENERAIGKIEEGDFEQVALTYRNELKVVLQRIDETLAPHRAQAEDAVRAHLSAAGLAQGTAAGSARAAKRKKTAPKASAPGEAAPSEAAPSEAAVEDDAERVVCPSCGASNERDAKFCKECATALHAASKPAAAVAPAEEESSDAR